MVKAITVCLICGLLGGIGGRALSPLIWPQNSTAGIDRVALQLLTSDDRSDQLTLDSDGAFLVGNLRSSAYAVADSRASTALLEAQIDSLMRDEPSFRRDFNLEALLLRYMELDPARALRFARDSSLPNSFMVTMFSAWGADDLESALMELQGIKESRLQRDAAVAIVMDLGGGRDAIERVAATIESHNKDAFISDLLVRFATIDPAAALRDTFELPDYWLRDQTAKRIAAEWVQSDPAEALAHVQTIADIEPRMRHAFHVQIWKEWISTDPDAALEYLTSTAGQSLFLLKYGNLSDAVRELAVRRPNALLEASDTLSPYVQYYIRLAAIPVIVDNDLTEAMRYAADLPDGNLKSQWFVAIATAYAREDPEKALQWAKEAGSSSIVDTVLSEVASIDLEYAVELSLERVSDSQSLANWMSPRNLSGTDIATIRAIAQKLMDAGEYQEPSVSRLTESWIQLDPEAALEWVLENSINIDLEYMANVASGIALSDAALAARAVSAMPAGARGAWVAEVATAYARSDLDSAKQWLAQFRFEPDYDDWVATVAKKLSGPYSGQDPRNVAVLLSTARRANPDVVSAVASEWAQTDPTAAAEWARDLDDVNASRSGVTSAVNAWWNENPEAARLWSLRLPRGSMRDGALGAIVLRSIEVGDSIDPAILNGFTADAAVADAFTASLPAFSILARSRPEAARAIAEEAIGDSGVRALVEAEIERAVRLKD